MRVDYPPMIATGCWPRSHEGVAEAAASATKSGLRTVRARDLSIEQAKGGMGQLE